jgi:glycosyltransferase involved in cell wall biosynthesis
MKVLCLPRYGRLGASSRVRTYQYAPFLLKNGIDLEFEPFLADDYMEVLYVNEASRVMKFLGAYRRRLRILRRIREYNLVWIEKEVLPWMPAWPERRIERLKVPYIVDYDDAIFHNYDRNRLGIVRGLLGGKIDDVMRRANIVVAGNDYLADRARLAGSARVEIVPTVIDLERYAVSSEQTHACFNVGWIGTPITAPYIQAVRTSLASLCKDGRARFIAIGSGPLSLGDVPVEVRPWSEETEASDIGDFDIGIMPLPDASWERGKCGYKLIQYMARGLPVVASPVGVNCQIVDHGENGFLASTSGEWEIALTRLRDDPILRRRMGQAARLKVERGYCLKVTAPRMLRLFHDAVRK